MDAHPSDDTGELPCRYLACAATPVHACLRSVESAGGQPCYACLQLYGEETALVQQERGRADEGFLDGRG